jgi:hypothetical protein
VERQLDGLLIELPGPIVGITCLAVGADSLFAKLSLRHKGSIEVVLPFPGYELKLNDPERQAFEHLLETASRVVVLERKLTDDESYLAAGKRVVDLAEVTIAVWDGKPAKGLGGTADIVAYALEQRKQVIHLDPINRSVTRMGRPF